MNIIRELRKQHHMTMKELGKIVGVAESTISLYETGKRQPDLDTLTHIADVFGVSIDKLMGRELSSDHEDTWKIRERLRTDPNYRLLFSAAENASPEHLKAAAAMLKALEPEEYDD